MTDGVGRQHFHDRIASLQGAVVAIGREVQRSIADATEAWLRRDCDAGRRVDARTAGWSARARDVELAAYELIATQQPMALDLRQLTTLVRLTESVARSGDLVAHVARSACFERDADAFSPRLRTLVVEMATVAARLFGDALAAFDAEDGTAGRAVEESDRELDLLRNELFATLLEGGVATAPAIDLALLGRFYERLGDHAVEIARRTTFVSTGEMPGPTA
ncbi:MAG: phosphate uptake regulator PhoU [Actinobacteria bacterium]|nr:phosphate uptake regulator PhoU [Actinomycetota bacterium]